MSLTIAKVGGSLFDLPDLAQRLSGWVDKQHGQIVLVPGGGSLVAAIRRMDHLHGFGDECAHWLALRAMTLNAHMLVKLISPSALIHQRAECKGTKVNILDAFAFCTVHDLLPHSWDVTSDSIAAQVALTFEADALVLLKSASPPGPVATWSANGYCDPWFSQMVEPVKLSVAAVNLRKMNEESESP
ncbi:MAG: hypothetical protein ACJ8C4_02445 [Gemmataceae bacterium]